MERASITLSPTPPYHFDLTAGFATYFRGRYGGDIFEDGVFHKLLEVNGQSCLAKVRSSGTIDAPCLEAELIGPDLRGALLTGARQQVTWILGIEQDVSDFYQMTCKDAVLAPLVEAMRGLHVPHTASIYEALTLAILGQQISSQVARVLRTLLIQTYGPSLEVDDIVYRSFPRPVSLADAGLTGLRALGFSARKSEYIWEISKQVSSGHLDLEALRTQSDEEVTRVLTGLRGVGLWTVNWLFIRAFGRGDGFPHGDLALCRVMGQLFNAGTPFTPEQALEYSRRWSPYRSYVTAYLFAAKRSGYAFPSVY